MAYTENGIRVVFGTETPEDFDPNATAPSKATSGPDSISNRSPAPVEPSCQGVDTTPASMPTPVPELRRVDNLSRSPADDASLTSDSSMVPSHAGDRLADPANDLPKDKDIVFLEPATYIKPETEQDSELGRRKKLRKIDFEHDVQVKERQLRLKVGQELVSPAALIGRHPGTLSVGVHGLVMHKTPAAGDGYHARIKEYILQEQCPRCPWDTNIEGTDIAVAMMALTGKSDVAVQLVRLLRPKKNELKKVRPRRVPFRFIRRNSLRTVRSTVCCPLFVRSSAMRLCVGACVRALVSVCLCSMQRWDHVPHYIQAEALGSTVAYNSTCCYADRLAGMTFPRVCSSGNSTCLVSLSSALRCSGFAEEGEEARQDKA